LESDCLRMIRNRIRFLLDSLFGNSQTFVLD
jgi:hypothetical protein